MKNQDFTTILLVDQSPAGAFAAINNVRGWWSGQIDGDTDRLGAEFTYRYEDVHRSRQRITEFIPGRRVVWNVVDSHLGYLNDKSEWTGTRIVFEISRREHKTEVRFTHQGLAPRIECYGACSTAWTKLIGGNLRRLIATGERQPDAFASTD